MYLISYWQGETLQLGIKTENGVCPAPFSPAEFFTQGLAALPHLENHLAQATEFMPEADLMLGPCVPNPSKIICVGLNYGAHANETGKTATASPTLFSKYNNALAGHCETIPIPPSAVQIDHEAELAVIIGKQGKYIPEAEALNYVLGYASANDVSARDLQYRTSQWILGKTPDKFLPLGPYLVTDVADPQNLDVKCWLNGELHQNSNTSDMIFSVAFLISYISQYMTLYPSDVILTGTPEGVILGTEEKIWIKAGDIVDVEIGHLGRLTNSFA